MPKHILFGATAAFVIALAGAAHAQDTDMSEPAMTDPAMTQEEMSDAVMDAAEDTMEAAEDTMEAAKEMQDDAMDGDTMMEPSVEPVMEDEPLMEMPPAPVMDTAPATSVKVACPEGTTAQPDGTCMVTGDWDGE